MISLTETIKVCNFAIKVRRTLSKTKAYMQKNRVFCSMDCTKNPRKAVWMRMAAHSWRTALKSLGGARTTVATAALNASAATDEESDPSYASLLRYPFKSPDELRHSRHLLPFPLPPLFSFTHQPQTINNPNTQPKRHPNQQQKQEKEEEEKEEDKQSIQDCLCRAF